MGWKLQTAQLAAELYRRYQIESPTSLKMINDNIKNERKKKGVSPTSLNSKSMTLFIF